jgi:hypothetical protein
MTRYVELAALSRRELENLLLAEQGGLARILQVVHTCTEPPWNVRREVERIVEGAVDRRPFLAAHLRGVEADQARLQADRNAVRWG